MRRLLDGEKLTFEGEWYRTDRAKLYSPPIGRVPIWMASGGPKSSALAAEFADGIIASVKVPAEALENVIEPARHTAASLGRPTPRLLATRWSIHAGSADEAWQALRSWRGLRAPGRLEAVDPMDLRQRADEMPREEVLGRYAVVADAEAIAATYRPLVDDVGADIVAFQIASLDQEETIRMIGAEVLPQLRARRLEQCLCQVVSRQSSVMSQGACLSG